MQNIMLDLETLSTRPHAHILSIGACYFDASGVGETFYASIVPQEQQGAHIDPLTVAWWLRQDHEARAALDREQEFLIDALKRFALFATKVPNVLMWGNGSDFDNVILSDGFGRNGLERPWEWYNNRCYRTIKSLFPIAPKPKPVVKHHALSDAVAQAEHLIEIRNKLYGEGTYHDANVIDLFDADCIKRVFNG